MEWVGGAVRVEWVGGAVRVEWVGGVVRVEWVGGVVRVECLEWIPYGLVAELCSSILPWVNGSGC